MISVKVIIHVRDLIPSDFCFVFERTIHLMTFGQIWLVLLVLKISFLMSEKTFTSLTTVIQLS